MGKLKITWHGHSCFTLEEEGYSIVLDPFADGAVPGFGNLRLGAASKKNPFKITEIHSWHDDAQGTKRGSNTIRIYDDGEYKVAHMGDIGCPPTAEQKEALKGIDVMLMPVGGFFTLEPEDVCALAAELKPRMLVPMHYRGEGFGYDVIAPLEKYASLCGGLTQLDKSGLSLPEDLQAGTVALKAPVA